MTDVNFRDNLLDIFLRITKITESGQTEGSRHHVSLAIDSERKATVGS